MNLEIIGKRVLYKYSSDMYVPAIIEGQFNNNQFGISYLYRGEWTFCNSIYGDDVNQIKIIQERSR